jgi:hypothetical protein
MKLFNYYLKILGYIPYNKYNNKVIHYLLYYGYSFIIFSITVIPFIFQLI